MKIVAIGVDSITLEHKGFVVTCSEALRLEQRVAYELSHEDPEVQMTKEIGLKFTPGHYMDRFRNSFWEDVMYCLKHRFFEADTSIKEQIFYKAKETVLM